MTGLSWDQPDAEPMSDLLAMLTRLQDERIVAIRAAEEAVALRAFSLHDGDPFVLHWVWDRRVGPRSIASFWPGRSDT